MINSANGTLILCSGPPRSGFSMFRHCVALSHNLESGFKVFANEINYIFLKQHKINLLSVKSLPDDWKKSAETYRLRKRIYGLLKDAVEGIDLFIIDPYLCRTLPLWQQAAASLKINCRYVLLVRHPWETSMSIANKETISMERAHLVWLHSVLEMIKYVGSSPWHCINYDQILENPVSTVHSLETFLQMKEENQERIDLHDSMQEIKLQKIVSDLLNYVQPDLKHHYAAAFPEAQKNKFTAFASYYEHLIHRENHSAEFGKPGDDREMAKGYSFDLLLNSTQNLLDSVLTLMDDFEEEIQSAGKVKQTDHCSNNYLKAQLLIPDDSGNGYRKNEWGLFCNQWQKISTHLYPKSALKKQPMILMPMNTNGDVVIASIELLNKATGKSLWRLNSSDDFDHCHIAGDALRLPSGENLHLVITGNRPELRFWPNHEGPECPLELSVWLKVRRDQMGLNQYINRVNIRESLEIERIAAPENRLPRFIVVNGMIRSGSTVGLKVVTELLAEAGLPYIKYYIDDFPDVKKIRDHFMQNNNIVFLLKTHYVSRELKALINESAAKLIYTKRNVFEVAASYIRMSQVKESPFYRVEGCQLNELITTLKNQLEQYRMCSNDESCKVYDANHFSDDILNDTVKSMGLFLGIPFAGASIDDIARKNYRSLNAVLSSNITKDNLTSLGHGKIHFFHKNHVMEKGTDVSQYLSDEWKKEIFHALQDQIDGHGNII